MPAHMNIPTEGRLSIWLVEDHAGFSANIKDLINETSDFSCDLAVTSCEEALASLEAQAAPDIILMDIGLPGLSGIEGIRKVKSIAPSVQVIMLTAFDDNTKIFQAICAGASGYLLKGAPPDEIIESLTQFRKGGAPVNAQIARKVLDMFADMAAPKGDYDLTPTEKQILHFLVEGKPIKQIAYEIGSSFHTVDTHVRNIYTKLQVHSRGSVVAKALKERLL